ncbi:hypothetical protein GWI33_006427 [Rhynchophorus ferrugineus]|uniref:Transposase n=1 Tax=Rhynchophorus ferrugineus TaxID=354439 RepID=A0A834MD17_RHYFE|nr:hypothetical protein GWI33_006427 [Rhynchophorus ferrugineus]
MSTEDGERSRRPKEFVTNGNIKKIHKMLLNDFKLCLKMIKRNKLDFLRRYMTMDETWLHHFTPKSNLQLSEWTAHDEPAPKRGKPQQSAGKVMASAFWDAHGIIFNDYLEKGRTINSDYYIALLDHLKDEIAEKQTHLKKKKVLLHLDNAPCHKSVKTMTKIHELGFELLPHPPYSPDLAPSDHFLFCDFKKHETINETKQQLRKQ